MHDDSAAVDTARQPGGGMGPRVLVMHHSAMRALLTEHVLTGGGCVVETLTDPAQLPRALGAFAPDLILSALPIAPFEGVELAVVRGQGDELRLVPILVAAVDHRRKHGNEGPEALAEGAPLLPPERLMEEVRRRIAAVRIPSSPAPTSPPPLAPAVAPPAAPLLPPTPAAPPLSTAVAPDHLDPETGLATRRHFMQCLGRAIGTPAGPEPGVGLLIVTLDGMAELNGHWGTGAAELAVDHIGRVIGERLSEPDLAVRLDDYRHAILRHDPGAAALRDFAETLRGAVATGFAVQDHPVTISVSIGIGLCDPAPADALTLIKRAERACGEAVAAGGNRVMVDLPGAAETAESQRLVRLIDRALAGSVRDEVGAVGGFQVFYQPMVAVRDQVLHYVDVILCLEALDGTLLESADFLPAAEGAGRVVAIDRWIMRHTLEVLVRKALAQPKLRLFVRQHVESLSEDAGGWLPQQLLAAGLIERPPILDLAAADLLRHRHLAAGIVGGLRKAGIQVCVAGVDQDPAVLELVTELHPPFVKLAPGVHQLPADRLNHLIRRLLQGQAELIACGIDSHALVASTWASGVGYAQGAAIVLPQPELHFDWDDVEMQQPD